MLSFIVGVVLGLGLAVVSGPTWWLVAALWGLAVLAQVTYAQMLNRHLGGRDPVATFGVRNLAQLRTVVEIPLTISAISFLAGVAGWAGGAALCFAVGWVELVKVVPK